MMNDLRDLLTEVVADDARGISGDVLADALRPSTRRRVRTRRHVRAAGVGSLAAVSAGGLAVGVTQLPGVINAQPGLVPGTGECPPGTVAMEGSATWSEYPREPGVEPTAHGIDVTTERDRETWIVYDDVLERPVLEVSPIGNGIAEIIVSNGTSYELAETFGGAFVFESPSGGWVTYDPDGATAFDWSGESPVAISASTAPTPAGDEPEPVCVTPSPRSTHEPSPAPSTSASEAKSDDLEIGQFPQADGDLPWIGELSPLMLGYFFEGPSQMQEHISVSDARMVDGEEARGILAEIFPEVEGLSLAGLTEVPMATVTASMHEFAQVEPVNTSLSSVDLSRPDTLEQAMGRDEALAFTSASFVAVLHDEVVGTFAPWDPAVGSGILVSGSGSNDVFITLIDPAGAFQPAPGYEDVDLGDVDLYAAATSSVTAGERGIFGPGYAWAPVAGS